MINILKEETSDFLKKLFKIWPISKLEFAKNIVIHDYWDEKSIFSCTLPIEDKLELLHELYFLLVPLERKQELIDAINRIFKKYKTRGLRSYAGTKNIEISLDKFYVYHESWHNLGTIHIETEYPAFTFIHFKLVRVSESFAILILKVQPSERAKYKFYQLFHTNHKSKVILGRPKLNLIFKFWPSTTIPSSQIFLKEFENILEEHNSYLIEFLKENNFLLTIGDQKKLPSLIVLNFRKEPSKNLSVLKYKNQGYNRFWDCLGFREHSDMYRESEGKFYLGKLNGNKMSPYKSQILYVKEELIQFDEMHTNLDNYISMIMNGWMTTLSPKITINHFLEYTYRKLDQFRKKYYKILVKKAKKIKIKKIMSISNFIDNQIYFFDRVKLEYGDPKSNRYRFNLPPNFYIEWDKPLKNKRYFYDFEKNKIELKITMLEDIVRYFTKIIDRSTAFRFSIGNRKIQISVFILAGITILIGVAQLIGLSKLEEYWDKIIKWLTIFF